jgi:HEPN domain-containing protein
MFFDNNSYSYWFDLAEYDMETAKAMQKMKRFLYVGFMCHQTIEKALKGIIVKKDPSTTIPYIHNLTKLSKQSGLYDAFESDQKDMLDILEPLNIEARYPTVKEKLLETLTFKRCEEILKRTEALFSWIKMRS